MAAILFYFKMILTLYLFYQLVRKTLNNRREKNAFLLAILSFVLILDVKMIIEGQLPQDLWVQLVIISFLLYFSTQLIMGNIKSSPIIRNFIDIKTLFESEIIDKLDEGVALIRSDTIERLSSNSAFNQILDYEHALIAIPDLVSTIMRGQHEIEFTSFENKKRVIHARLEPYGKRYALLYIKDITSNYEKTQTLNNFHRQVLSNWESSPSLVMLRKLTGEIIYVNPAMSAFVHMTQEVLVGRHFSYMYEDEIDYADHLALQMRLIHEESEWQRGLLKIRFPLKSKRYFECEEQFSQMGDEVCILTTASDMTAQVTLELIQQANRLKDDNFSEVPFVIANLISYDFLFLDQIEKHLDASLSSISAFISGLNEEDATYFNNLIRHESDFEQRIICFAQKYHFYVQERLISGSGHLIGIYLKYLNPEINTFSMPIIGSLIINHIKEGILILDEYGQIEYSNEMAQRILNYTRAELSEKNILDLTKGLTREILNRNLDLVKQHDSLHFERIYLTKDGLSVPSEVIAMHLKSGQNDHMLLLIRDISEKFIYKKRLIDSQSRYAQIFESLQEGVFEIVLPEKQVRLYREFDAEKGLIGMEVPFLQWLNSIHEEDYATTYEAIDVLTSEKRQNHEFEYRYFKHGVWKWYRGTCKYIETDEGASIIIINRDITEMKKIDDKLEENLKILSESERISQMSHWKFDITRGGFMVSESFSKVFMMKPDVDFVYYEAFITTIHPADKNYFENKFKKFLWDKEPLDIVFRWLFNGNLLFVQINGQVYYTPEGVADYAIGNIKDVTERVMTIRKYEESRLLLSQVVKKTPLGTIVVKQDGHIESINERAIELLRIEGEHLIDKVDLLAHFIKKFSYIHGRPFDSLFESTHVDLDENKACIASDLSNRYIEIQSKLLHDADGQPIGRLLSIQEVQN